MNEERPSPPRELKPWYYQDWFLFPMFIFWPLWAVLILRSPWHNGVISGAIAWAMLIAGSFLVAQRLRLGGTVAESTLIFIIPGLVLTVITQVLWLRDKRALREKGQPVDSPTVLRSPFKSRRARTRQQGRRRSSRSGRNARGRR
ncbi:MAG TPA: hypothetical protein VFA32_21435 [Dehalococcoidia bacterium]|nr:hypothetical protein [Dehalococcoidia bacterium]